MTVGRTVRTRALIAASWLACHLPEGPLTTAAELGGDLWYRLAPERAAQARRNLRRVCVALAASGRGSALVQAAATDPRALERLVRSAFRHAARYYLEVARTPALRPGEVDRRLEIETPEIVAEAFAPGRAVLFVGLHFGAIELPALFLASRVGGAVAPMETIDDEALQAWFTRTRGAAGVRIVGLREARRALPGRPARRDVGRARRGPRPDGRRDAGAAVRGPGHAPARPGHARGRERRDAVRRGRPPCGARPLPGPAGTDRRPVRGDAARAGHGHDDEPGRARSSGSSRTPRRSGGPCSSRSGRTSRRRRREPGDGRRARRRASAPRRASAGRTSTSTRSPRTGRPASRRSSITSSPAATSTSSPSPTTSGSMRRWRPGGSRRIAGCPSRSSSARRSRPAAATCSRSSSRRGSDRTARSGTRSRPSTTPAVSRSRPTRSCPSRCAPRAGSCAASSRTWTSGSTRTPSRPSTRPRSGDRGTRGSSRFADRYGLAHIGNSDAHALTAVGAGWTSFPGRTADDLRDAIAAGGTEHHGTFHGASGQLGVFGRQLSKRGRDARDELVGRWRQDGTGRDHGYPGGRQRPPRHEP